MSQLTFRSGSGNTLREIAPAIRKALRAAAGSIKAFAAEILILGAMLFGVLVLKLVHIAVSNPGVADALVAGRLFF